MARCYCVVLLWSLNSHLETGEKIFTIHPFVFVTLFFHLISFFHVFSLHSTINFEQTCWFIALHDFDEQSKYFREAMHFNYYFFFLHIFFFWRIPISIIICHSYNTTASLSWKRCNKFREIWGTRLCSDISWFQLSSCFEYNRFFNSDDSKLTTIWSTILFHPFLYQYMKYKKAFNEFILLKGKENKMKYSNIKRHSKLRKLFYQMINATKRVANFMNKK